MPPRAAKSKPPIIESSSSPQRDGERVYCICRKPYDETEFYIGCDKCESWFHGRCVGIDESQSKRIEDWFCGKCKELGFEDKHSLPCFRDECTRLSLTDSKYCSEACAMKYAREMLNLAIPHLKPYPRKVSTDPQLKIIHARRKLLIRALEKRQLLLDNLLEKLLEMPICGFDPRVTNEWFVDLDMHNDPSDPVEGEFSMDALCLAQGKCIRHAGWKSLKSREIELLLDEQITIYKQEMKNSVL